MVFFLFAASSAYGQEAPGLRPHHITIEAGLNASGAYDVGSSKAELRGNGMGATPPSFTLLQADSRVTPATAAELRLGFALTRHVSIEVRGLRSAPHIGVGISRDAEAQAQELPGEQLRQFVVDGGVSWQLPFATRRAAPFVSAGAGYLRQLHEDRMLGETGRLYYAGGGVRYWLRGGDARSTSLGLRGDIRINLRQNGIDFENAMRMYPTMSLSVFLGL